VKTRIHRRTLLKGLLGGAAVSIGLPPLEAFINANGTAYAGGGTSFPKRFGVFFWGNGVLPARWDPTAEGADYALTPQLMPLAALKSDFTVISGTRVLTTNSSPHLSGPAGLFTGDALRGGTVTRPSIDQVIAQELGGETRFRSLEIGVQRSNESYSFAGPNQVNPPETSPRALFNRLFGEGFRMPGEMTVADPRVGLRRSVLDAVGGQATDLRNRLGMADRVRLDQHLEGVRGLERQIARLEENPPNLAACRRPEMPAEEFPDVDGRRPMSAISRAMSDLMAMALACDQTRVFFNMYSQSVNNTLFPGAPAGHHQLTHDEPGEQPMVDAIVRLMMGDLAYFLTALRNVQEGDGNLLQHSIVLATTDCSYGKSHSIDDYPLILAGSGGGSIATGRHIAARGENSSKVMLSVLRAMGVRAPEFGVGAGRTADGLSALAP
jgi:hypothetical protein